ncbi:pheST operon leader peptide PheM [Providencia burhodogranariea]
MQIVTFRFFFYFST